MVNVETKNQWWKCKANDRQGVGVLSEETDIESFGDMLSL